MAPYATAYRPPELSSTSFEPILVTLGTGTNGDQFEVMMEVEPTIDATAVIDAVTALRETAMDLDELSPWEESRSYSGPSEDVVAVLGV